MRRLFITLFFLVILSPLAGCDSERQSLAIGEWTLQRVETRGGQAITGPLGSVLVFEADGSFRIESGNDCSGRFTSIFVVNVQLLDFSNVTCTERATTAETDLARTLGIDEDEVGRSGPLVFAGDPLRMDISVDTPEASRTLVFAPR